MDSIMEEWMVTIITTTHVMLLVKTITITVTIKITITTTITETPPIEIILIQTTSCQTQIYDNRTPDILIVKQTHKIKAKGNKTFTTTTATHDHKITHAVTTKSVCGYDLKFNFKPFRLSFTQKTYQ